MKDKKTRRSKSDSDRKLRDAKKTNQQLKAQIRQLRKMLTLAEEEIIRLRDVVGDAAVVEVARKITRGKRKKLRECSTCGILGVEDYVTDFGHREMVITACTSCGTHYNREFRKKE